MSQVLAMVSSHADAGPFKLPVTRKQAPDYRIIVKRPMALSNVKSMLEKGQSIDQNSEFSHPSVHRNVFYMDTGIRCPIHFGTCIYEQT